MKTAKLFLAITTSLTIFLIHCSLNQYSHQPSLKIYTKFPGKRSSTSSLSKPTGVATSYVPAFVDRIILTITGTSVEGEAVDISVTKLSTDEGFSAEFEPPDLPFSNNLTINAKAYTCRNADLSCCEPDDLACSGEKWILTHEATAEGVAITGGIEESEVSLPLTIQNDADGDSIAEGIDFDKDTDFSLNNTFDFQTLETYNVLPEFHHSLAVDLNGNFAIAWFNQIFSIGATLKIYFFDSNGRFLHGADPIQPFATDELYYNINGSSHIEYHNSTLYLCFIKADTYEIGIGRFNEPYDRMNDSQIIVSPSGYATEPHMQFLGDKIIVAWKEGTLNSIVRFQIFDIELNPLISEQSIQSSGLNIENPQIKILDEDHFAVFAYRSDQRIIGNRYKIIENSDGLQIAENETQGIELNWSSQNTMKNHYSIDFIKILPYEDDIDLFLVFENEVTPETPDPTPGNYDLVGISFEADLSSQISSFNWATNTSAQNQRRPIQVNSRNKIFLTVYTDNTQPSGVYTIRYMNSDFTDAGKLVNENPDFENQVDPNASFNEDGFGVISWSTDGNKIQFKRFLF